MKKVSMPLLAILSVTLGSCVISGWDTAVSGNGNVIEETRKISGFEGVKVNSGIDVYLCEGQEFEVRVEADENLMEVIVTELKGNVLVVKTEGHNIRNARSKKVHVTLPELKELKISSAGNLHAYDLIAKKVEVDVSSAGNARIFASEEISMNASSAGNIYYMGDARVLRSGKSSAGNIKKKN